MTRLDRDRRFASTLAKGLQVMQAFKPTDKSLGNRELARRTGMPPSTIARMTFTLTSLGFLEQLGPSEAYRLGPSAMALGYTARATLSFLPVAENLMQGLADDTGVLTALTMRNSDTIMFTRCWRPRDGSSLWLSEGHKIPLGKSAAGRAILAMEPRRTDEPSHRRADRDQLESRGFVLSYGGWKPDVNACAVPFQSEPGSAPFAFICGAGASDLGVERLEQKVAPMLRDKVRTLKLSLGLM